ncbi:odorant receptor 22c-like [Diachasmimorpha longicaudata]|uniref:odorant receptor 22c-like n=1 Tax=Diachasmimorpha longicaudata TaxID=58733 RepID=UPI0030B8A51B
MTSFVDGMTGVFGLTVAALKILCPWIQQERMRYVMQSVMEDWSNVCDKRSRKIMNQYAFWGRLTFSAQIIAVLVTVIGFSAARPPNFTTEAFRNNSSSTRNLLLGPSCWIPDTMSTSLYLLHYFLVCVAAYIATVTFPGFDALIFSAALHLCGQFEVLNQKLEDMSDGESHWEQKRRIEEYSKRHNKLLTLGNEVNNIVSLIMFSEFFCNGLLISLSGISILTSVKNGKVDSDDISFGIRICIWYGELFMYSYVGEKLASQADKSHSTIYNCPWYSMSVNIAKEIKIIMMRNNSFCYLTAGGIFVINFEAFKEITRIMFSCFSVLKVQLE